VSCFLGVLATDLCTEALQRARAGYFRAKRLEQIPEALRRRFFVVDNGLTGRAAANEPIYRASPTLQRRLCFAQTNLLNVEQLPTMPMDVIFCQNVLVYFRRWRAKQVLDALAERLKPGGLLVLGPGEAAHWQHPALVRMAHQGVTAWLRRVDAPPSVQTNNSNTDNTKSPHQDSSSTEDLGSSHKVEQHGRRA
jgi:chemotaxis protein methyltransferase CheR/type IV pilus assembly protein PilK